MDQYFTWLKTHKNQLENIESEKQEIIKSKVWDSISEIFIARNSIYGTVVKKNRKRNIISCKKW